MKETKIPWPKIARPDGTLMPGYTFNPWWGCERAAGRDGDANSPACDNCYAEAFSHRLGKDLWGSGSARRLDFEAAHDAEPLTWNAKAFKTGEQHGVFCGSMMDIAEDRRDLDAKRRMVFEELVPQTPNLLWLFLTKRPDVFNRICPWKWMKGQWPANVWYGVTVESQPYLWRAKEAMVAPAPVHFISYEPALGDIDFSSVLGNRQGRLQWLICGSESGHKAREVPLYRAESALQQCRDAGANFYMKQLDAKLLGLGRRGHAIEDLARLPAHLRVREHPAQGHYPKPLQMKML